MESQYIILPGNRFPLGLKVGDRVTRTGGNTGVIVSEEEWEKSERGQYADDNHGEEYISHTLIAYKSDEKLRDEYYWHIFASDITKVVPTGHAMERSGQLLMF